MTTTRPDDDGKMLAEAVVTDTAVRDAALTDTALADAVLAGWGWRLARLQPLRAGHTNQSVHADAEGRPVVVRVSWPGKPARQVMREARLLRALQTMPGLPALPRPLPTRQARPCMRLADGRWLHVFAAIPGDPGPGPAGHQALQALARLHRALAHVPARRTGPAAWLEHRHARVLSRAAPALPASMQARYGAVLTAMPAALQQAALLADERTQWLHGDFHAGNLLWANGALTGIVDFDDPGVGAPLLEAAFAAFAFSRDAAREDAFVFDQARWAASLGAYAQAADVSPLPLLDACATLATLFCIDQVLIHLEAAQRGLWSLSPGIGFHGPWHHLAGA